MIESPLQLEKRKETACRQVSGIVFSFFPLVLLAHSFIVSSMYNMQLAGIAGLPELSWKFFIVLYAIIYVTFKSYYKEMDDINSEFAGIPEAKTSKQLNLIVETATNKLLARYIFWPLILWGFVKLMEIVK